MPKHVPSEHYFGSPYKLGPKVTIHPEIEHHDHPTDTEYYLLPTVFHAEKGDVATVKYPGPGIFYLTEGEGRYEDTKKPGSPTVTISAGSVIHIEDGAILRWYCHSGMAKGFAVFYVPAYIKSYDEFIVPE